MPNWCYNEIEIQGPFNEIESIMQTECDFQKILPTPQELLEVRLQR